MSILHPVKTIRRAIIRHLIKEALEELPALKALGKSFLKDHADEFISEIKDYTKTAVKSFIHKKLNQAKTKLIKTTDSKN